MSALRLTEKGYKVLVIEKGMWYHARDFPKTNWNFRRWLWIPLLRCFGIMRISFFRHITILSGVGVGGGSLVYANTLPVPRSRFFNSGSWAGLNNWEKELEPYYAIALKMLGATQTPRLFDGDQALKQVAKRLGKEEGFSPATVGVYFGRPNVKQPDPYFEGQGPERTGCNFCGACMTGCRNNSKNSLDKNYLYLAQKNGAEILAEQEVTDIKPLKEIDGSGGYEIKIKSSTNFFKKTKTITSRGVVVSGGVLGTVKLLLKLKKSSLPNLSDRLGKDIRTNNETLISVYSDSKKNNFSRGVAIGSILHTDENSHLEICRYGEGSDAWKLVHVPYSALPRFLPRIINTLTSFFKSPLDYVKLILRRGWARNSVVLLFMQTLDSTLVFRRNILGKMSSRLAVEQTPPTPFIPESQKLTSLYAEEVEGTALSFVGETLMGIPSTAHILGGAVMGKTRKEGVIDKNNRVFGYRNMYIVDGSMISANPGVNPSLTITAIAERAMAGIDPKT